MLKVTLAADGSIPKIVIVGDGLHPGLLRNTLFSAMRIKFLPQEKDAVPSEVAQKFEYAFSIY